jgi:hypothetical protein
MIDSEPSSVPGSGFRAPGSEDLDWSEDAGPTLDDDAGQGLLYALIGFCLLTLGLIAVAWPGW